MKPFRAFAVALLACGLLTVGGGESAFAGSPPLDLKVNPGGKHSMKLVRKNSGVKISTLQFHESPLLATGTTPLELWVHRTAPDQPPVAETVDRSTGSPVASAVPGLEFSMDRGLRDFLRIRIRNSEGKVVFEHTGPFCPRGVESGSRASIARSGRSGNIPRPIYPGHSIPVVCGDQQADSLVWMVGPDSPVYTGENTLVQLPDGNYRYEVELNPNRVLPESDFRNDTFVQEFSVITNRGLWLRLTRPQQLPRSPAVRSFGPVAGRPAPHEKLELRPPTAEELGGPDGGLPDPTALAPARFGLESAGGRTRITFSSIMANLGNAPIALFGSRRDSAGRKMRGWQYLKGDDGKLVRRAINGFVWNDQDGHHHWHYNHLADYELLSMDGKVLRRSSKIGFCFLPTVAVHFEPVPGSEGVGVPSLPAERDGLRVACGKRASKQVAMSLPAGWGDEYYQVAGQSLDVTGLADGNYRLRITVNPQGDLAEATDANNVSERLIELKGEGSKQVLYAPEAGPARAELSRIKIIKPASSGSVSDGPWTASRYTPRMLCGLRPSTAIALAS